MIHFTNASKCGYIPRMLSLLDPRGAVAQLHENYAHGGGWHKFGGFKLVRLSRNLFGEEGEFYGLKYPGDPPMREIGRGVLRDETVVLFEGSWVAVISGEEMEVARMD